MNGITVLVENAAADNEILAHEHGLSFLVCCGGKRILFDCGATDAVVRNAGVLGVELRAIDLVVLSHAHYDHCGGFGVVVRAAAPARLVTGEDFFLPKYSVSGLRHTYLGINFTPEFLEENKIEHTVCADRVELAPGCWAVSGFSRDSGETIADHFRIWDGSRFVPDPFRDEVCLAVRWRDGLALIVGCGHPGILNVVESVGRRLKLPVLGVWGGSHLVEADSARMENTLGRLKELGVRHLGLCHCSGEAAEARVASDPEVVDCRLRTGDGIHLEVC